MAGYSLAVDVDRTMMTYEKLAGFMVAAALVLPHTSAIDCRFPEHWHGVWYQNSLGDVIIQDNFISGKGRCREKHNEFYVMEHINQQGTSCSKCMLIMQKHPNIIQYKESFCLPKVGSAKKCKWDLTVEYPLHTLVKDNAHPVECPFAEAYKFKYKNNTRTFCEKPASYVKPCAKTSKFHFRFRHCRNLEQTHEKELEFLCLATWKDGYDKFLYGGFSGPGIANDEDMFRCFKYEADGSPATDINIAMSADASCQGLSSAVDGPVVMQLTRDFHGWDLPRCTFPEWLRHHRWRDLSGHYVFEADKNGKVWNIIYRRHGHGNGHVTSALRCHGIFQDDARDFVAVTFTSDDCDSFYQCIQIRRIKDNVIEFSKGPPNTYQIDFCASDGNHESKKILFNEDIQHTDCPFPGRLESAGIVTSDIDVTSCSSKILNGCNGSHVMQIQNHCVEKTESERLECLSDWTHEGKHYVIVRQTKENAKTGNMQRTLANCFTYAYEGANLRVQTDLECNMGAPDVMGEAMEALLEGHANPCHKLEEMTPQKSHSSAAGRCSHSWTSFFLLILLLTFTTDLR